MLPRRSTEPPSPDHLGGQMGPRVPGAPSAVPRAELGRGCVPPSRLFCRWRRSSRAWTRGSGRARRSCTGCGSAGTRGSRDSRDLSRTRPSQRYPGWPGCWGTGPGVGSARGLELGPRSSPSATGRSQVTRCSVAGREDLVRTRPHRVTAVTGVSRGRMWLPAGTGLVLGTASFWRGRMFWNQRPWSHLMQID